VSENPITDAVLGQVGRSWQELRRAVEATPPDDWIEGSPDYLRPARLAYHILFTADMYATHMGYEEYRPHRTYKIDWEGPVDALPAKAVLLQWLAQTEMAVRDWLISLGDQGLLSPETQYPWTGATKLDRALYLLRHNMWHIGELNAILRSRGCAQVEW